jgi:hypothetical protein
VEDRALQLFPDKSAVILVTQTVVRAQSLHGESCRCPLRAKLLHAKNWIGGDWVDSPTRLNSIDPATGEVIGSYADRSADEASRAIVIARKAFLEAPCDLGSRPPAGTLGRS